MRQLRALLVAGAVVLAGQAAASKSAMPASHKVKRGETLSHIARRYKTTVDALQSANTLADPRRLRAGQVIKLVKPAPKPKPAAATKPAKPAKPAPLSTEKIVLGEAGTATYKVVKGDNLSKIAKKFDTTVSELRKANNLKAKKALQIGATLKVPGTSWACPVQGAKRFNNDWSAYRHGNRLHMGNDVFAARGTPVVAPVGGRIEVRSGGLGGLAFFLHGTDGVRYYGAHLDRLEVQMNQQVKAGQRLGTVGNTGNARSTPAHLHFEIQPTGKPTLNPYFTLKRWC